MELRAKREGRETTVRTVHRVYEGYNDILNATNEIARNAMATAQRCKDASELTPELEAATIETHTQELQALIASVDWENRSMSQESLQYTDDVAIVYSWPLKSKATSLWHYLPSEKWKGGNFTVENGNLRLSIGDTDSKDAASIRAERDTEVGRLKDYISRSNKVVEGALSRLPREVAAAFEDRRTTLNHRLKLLEDLQE